MPCPGDLLDALESVVEIFCSSVKHKERAAFILCDNLVEVACKAKAHQHNHAVNLQVGFHLVLQLPGVVLDEAIRERLQRYRNTRNNLQHVGGGLTVDEQHCADAIMDSVEALNQLWPDAPVHTLRSKLRVSLRIVRLLGAEGDTEHRLSFTEGMLDFTWRNNEGEQVKRDAVQIRPGLRDYWGHAIFRRTADVQRLLDETGVPVL